MTEPDAPDPTWVIWTWLPRLGWFGQRRPYSSRKRVDGVAEQLRHFFVSCGLPGIVEVHAEADGEPPPPPNLS